jgi:hypothetical protein
MDNNVLSVVVLLGMSSAATKAGRGMFLEKIVLYVVEILIINLPRTAIVIMLVTTPGKREVTIPDKQRTILEEEDLTFGMTAGSLVQGISAEQSLDKEMTGQPPLEVGMSTVISPREFRI